MNEIQYDQENNIKYMKMEFTDITEDAKYEMNMLIHNKISSFLPISVKTINNKNIYFYNITSRQQLCKVFEFNKMQLKDVEMILNSIEALTQTVNDYMLNLDSVIITSEFLFLDLTNSQMMFTYIPKGDKLNMISNTNKTFDDYLKELFDFIIEHYDHENDKKSVIKVYNIYQKIIQHEYNFTKISELLYNQNELSNENQNDDSFDALLQTSNENEGIVIHEIPQEIIEDEEESKNHRLDAGVSLLKMISAVLFVVNAAKILAPSIVPLPYEGITPVIMCIIFAIMLLGLSKLPQYIFIQQNKKTISQPYVMNSSELCNNKNIAEDDTVNGRGDDNELNDIHKECEHTMLLSDYIKNNSKDKKIKMVYCGDNQMEDLFVESVPCVIGSMKEHCQCIINSKIVSHIHMCILKIDDTYYVEDMNSTNGTYVNGERLLCNTRREIKKDDIIQIATLPYKVEMI